MKKILSVCCLLGLVGCSSLDIHGKCYYGAIPQQYIMGKDGQQFVNPEYVQYTKCYGAPASQQVESSTGTVLSLLKDSYVVNGKSYTLLNGQRQFKPGGGYVKSVFTTEHGDTGVAHEIFSYFDSAPFQQRFFKDMNDKEGRFQANKIDGIDYFIGVNNHKHHVIYIVKKVLSNEISIVQFTSKTPFKQNELPQLVRDLNKI